MKNRNLIRKIKKARLAFLKGAVAAFFLLGAGLLPSAKATSINLSPDEEFRRPDDYYNIKVPNSSLRLGFTSSFTAAWDSNIGRSGYYNGTATASNESGFYVQPALTMAIDWPVSSWASINSSLGIAYRYFPDGKGESDFFLTGDSGELSTGIASEMKLGQNGKLTAGAKIARSIESLQKMAANNNMRAYSTTTLEGFLQYENDLSETLHTIDRYSHTFAWHSPNDYKYLDYQSDMVDLLLLQDMWKGGSVGPYLTVTDTYYSSKQKSSGLKRNDCMDYSFGAAFRHVGPITISGRLGYELADYNENNSVATDQGSTPTYQLDIMFGTGERFIHRISSSYGLASDFLSPQINYSKQWQNGYAVSYRMSRKWLWNADVNWLKSDESDNGQKSDLVRFGIGPTYEIGPNTQLALRYEYTQRFSKYSNGEYDRTVISLTLQHKF